MITCPDCKRVFDLSDHDQNVEWYSGHRDCVDVPDEAYENEEYIDYYAEASLFGE